MSQFCKGFVQIVSPCRTRARCCETPPRCSSARTRATSPRSAPKRGRRAQAFQLQLLATAQAQQLQEFVTRLAPVCPACAAAETRWRTRRSCAPSHALGEQAHADRQRNLRRTLRGVSPHGCLANEHLVEPPRGADGATGIQYHNHTARLAGGGELRVVQRPVRSLACAEGAGGVVCTQTE